jgi:hypothetical protein
MRCVNGASQSETYGEDQTPAAQVHHVHSTCSTYKGNAQVSHEPAENAACTHLSDDQGFGEANHPGVRCQIIRVLEK